MFAASKFAGRGLKPRVLNRSLAVIEESSHPRKTPQVLGKSQRKAVNAMLENESRHAPIVTFTLGKRGKYLQLGCSLVHLRPPGTKTAIQGT